MSRHSLQPLADKPHIYEVAIGWDRPLLSFFVIVFGAPEFDGDDDDGRAGDADELAPLLWEGTSPGALAAPAEAIALASAYAQIPGDLADRLAADRAATGGSANGPAQQAWLDALCKPSKPKDRP
jgi:hypothetical protein